MLYIAINNKNSKFCFFETPKKDFIIKNLVRQNHENNFKIT